MRRERRAAPSACSTRRPRPAWTGSSTSRRSTSSATPRARSSTRPTSATRPTASSPTTTRRSTASHEIAEERIAKGAPIVIVQPGGVYGPGDHSEVGNMIEQTSTGKLPAEGVPRARAQLRARGRRGRRDPARLRQGQGRRVVRAGRRDHDEGDLIDKAAAIGGKKPPRMTVPPVVLEGAEPGEPLGRAHDGPAAELQGDDLGRPQRHVLGEGRQGPHASWATARATWTPACARRSARAESQRAVKMSEPNGRRPFAAGVAEMRQPEEVLDAAQQAVVVVVDRADACPARWRARAGPRRSGRRPARLGRRAPGVFGPGCSPQHARRVVVSASSNVTTSRPSRRYAGDDVIRGTHVCRNCVRRRQPAGAAVGARRVVAVVAEVGRDERQVRRRAARREVPVEPVERHVALRARADGR